MCVDWCHAHTSHNRYISRLCAVSVRARFFMNHLMHDSMDTIHALNQFIYYFIRGNWFIYCQFTLDSFTHARGQTNKLAHTLASTVEFITQWAIQVCCLLHNKSAVDDAICAACCLSFFLYLKKTNYRRFSFPSLHPIGQTTMMHNAEKNSHFVCLFVPFWSVRKSACVLCTVLCFVHVKCTLWFGNLCIGTDIYTSQLKIAIAANSLFALSGHLLPYPPNPFLYLIWLSPFCSLFHSAYDSRFFFYSICCCNHNDDTDKKLLCLNYVIAWHSSHAFNPVFRPLFSNSLECFYK